VQRFYDYYDQTLYSSMDLSYAIAYDEATYGKRKLVTGYGRKPWQEFADETPMNDRAKKDLVRAFTEERDYLPGKTRAEKAEILRKLSYRDFLKDYVKVDHQVLEMYQRWGMSYWCVGMDEVPAISIRGYTDGGGLPGLAHTMPRVGTRGNEPYIFHFPDGNASVARLLVRKLIPEAVPGKSMEDSVTTRINYSKLDQEGAALKIRLNSTVVDTAHTALSDAVDVTYVHQGDAHTVRAAKCILACYNSAIPYICPELPEEQKKGLAYNIKVPLTYTKVMVRNWQAFADLGIKYVFYTNDFYKQVELDYPVSIGDYKFSASPDKPMVLHMCYVPYFDDIQGPEQWRAGRRKMLTTPFSVYEHHVRDQLDQALSGTGFDGEKDIEAITVNRWAHGYSYSPNHTWDPDYDSEEDKPWVKGRKPFGRITIANSDAGAAANTNSAITHAYRAVQESISG
jgi:spermidine dehydrogenase